MNHELKTEILSRIDASPYRAPTIADFTGNRAEISWAIAELMAAGVIDTANGDSGLTYTRRKAVYVAPVGKQPELFATEQREHGFFFPSKHAQPSTMAPRNEGARALARASQVPRLETAKELAMQRQDALAAHAKKRRDKREQDRAARAAKVAADRAAAQALKPPRAVRGEQTRRLVALHIVRPMSTAMFATAANTNIKAAASMLSNQVNSGNLLCTTGMPKIFYFAGMETAQAREQAAEFKRQSALFRLGYRPEQIAKEYAAGGKIKDICKRWGGNPAAVRECVHRGGARLRSRAENGEMVAAERLASAPRNRRIDAFAGRAEA